jgi:hypothetical protein
LKSAPASTNPVRLIIVFGIIISIAWMNNVVWINSVYGQSAPENAFPQFPTIPTSNNNNAFGGTTTAKPSPTTQPRPPQPPPSSPTTGVSQSSSSPIEHGVRITSPSKGQQVPVGVLTISGISKDNATSDCHVNVIVNHVRPYQNVSATGARGANDYSNWTFSLTPKYTVIKAGVNEITAKFFCNPNSDVASFYSMNVTGVQAAAGLQGGGGGGQTKMASATSSSTTATVTNQTRTIVSK